jgi:sugar lactone lactonase YvrE
MSHRSGSILGFAARFVLSTFLAVGIVLFLRGPANADSVALAELGQLDMFSSIANSPTAASMNLYYGYFGNQIAVDGSSSPHHLWVADGANNRVLGFRNAAALSNGQTADLVIGQPNFQNTGCNDYYLCRPAGVAVDSAGNLYVADSNNNRILVFSNPFAINGNTGQTSGFIPSMVIGQGGDFYAIGCNLGGSQPDEFTLCTPQRLTIDGSGNLWVADTGNNRVLEYNNPVLTGNLAATMVIGQPDFVSNQGNQGASTNAAGLSGPNGLAVDAGGNLYVADTYNCRVLRYQSPLANGAAAGQVWGQGGSFITANCGGASPTSLYYPSDVAVDGSNSLYIADLYGQRVLEFQEIANPPSNFNANIALGQPNTTSGGCNQGTGIPAANTLCYPAGFALDGSGNLFVSDSNNSRVVKYPAPLTSNENASVVLGQPDFTHNSPNELTASSQNQPQQIAIDASATPHRLYVADSSNNRVLGWRNATSFTNGAPADMVIGQPDFNSSGCASPSATSFCNPLGVAVDASGNLYISDNSYSRILEFTSPFASCGSFPCVYAGSANLAIGQNTITGKNFTKSGCNQGGSVTSLTMCNPRQIAVDSVGNLYVADYGDNRVAEYNTPLATTTVTGSGDAKIDLVWGQGKVLSTSSCNKVGGVPSAGNLCNPTAVATDPSNNVYIGDYGNHRVVEFNETTNATTAPSNATANHVFGTGNSFTVTGCSSSGAAGVCYPFGLATDSAGNMFLADYGWDRVFEYFTPLTVTGVSGSGDTIADYVFGQGGVLSGTSCNFGAVADAETLCSPYGVATDSSGDILIADTGNNRSLLFQGPFTVANNDIGKLSEQSNPITLSVSPTTLLFSKTRVGRRSASQSIAVTNHNAFPVTIGAPKTPAGDFSTVSGCGPVIPAGVTCNLRVTFNPVTEGKRGGSILIGDSSTGGPYLVDLGGSALKRKGRK